MGAQLRVFRRRISSVQSTKKITRAMELIAASRIVKAQQRVAGVDAVRRGDHRRLSRSSRAARRPSTRSPTRAGEPEPGGGAGDHQRPRPGRCLQHNALRPPSSSPRGCASEGKDAVPYVVGRKGVGYYRFRNREIAESWTGFSEQPHTRTPRRSPTP